MLPFTKIWELCKIPKYKSTAEIIYRAFHSDKSKVVARDPYRYLPTYLTYAADLDKNPTPPKVLSFDGWNRKILIETTTFCYKGIRAQLYAYEFYMLHMNKLPPKEYFDKNFDYEI